MVILIILVTGVISVDDNAQYADCATSNKTSVLSILELAELQGLATGVVTTARLTHATPSTTYAHSVSRRWENDAAVPDPRCKDIGKYRPLHKVSSNQDKYCIPKRSIFHCFRQGTLFSNLNTGNKFCGLL